MNLQLTRLVHFVLLLGITSVAKCAFATPANPTQDQRNVRTPSACAAFYCPLMDEGEGEGEGEPAFEGNAARRSATRFLSHFVPLTTAAIVIAYACVPYLRRRGPPPTAVLLVLAGLAMGNYTDWGRWPHGRYVNHWEHFHYYLGSKYHAELGYTRLYAAALIADDETQRKFNHPKNAIRDLVTGGCIGVPEVLAQRDSIVAHFTPERWHEFKSDVRYFKKQFSPLRWSALFHDKGYNATPVWTMLVATLTHGVPASHDPGLWYLSLIDPILLACALLAVWRVFGATPALLLVILLGTHMTMSHTHMKGALLRTDWIACLVGAVCAAKIGSVRLSGALAAWAACARVFPAAMVLLMFGRRALPVRSTEGKSKIGRFCLAFAVTVAGLGLCSALVLGTDYWLEFARKIWQHNDSFSPWRVGFKHVFLGAYEYRIESDGTLQALFHQRMFLWWGIQVAVLLVCVVAARRVEAWEALAMGFVPTFFLVAPTYYYYIMLLVPCLFFAGRIQKPLGAIGAAWLLVTSSIAFAIHDAIGRDLRLFYAISLMIFMACLLMVFTAFHNPRRNERPLLGRG